MMNLGALSLTVLSTISSFLSAVQVGDFIVISGLVNKPEYNGSIGLVQKLGEVGERHLVLRADSECIRRYTPSMDLDECVKSILVKDTNMVPIEWNIPEKLSIAQVLLNFRETGRVSNLTDHEISAEERHIIDQLILNLRVIERYKENGLFSTLSATLERFLRNFHSYIDRTIHAEEREFLDRILLMIRSICNDNPSKLRKRKNIEKLRLIGAWINQNYDFYAMVYVYEASGSLKGIIKEIWDKISF
jgi:hypothetical protein